MNTVKGAMRWLTAEVVQRVKAVEALLRAAYEQQADGEANVVAIMVDLRQVCAARGYDWERVVRRSAWECWAREEARGEASEEGSDT